MGKSKADRLRECRALGTLAGMTSAGVAVGAYFMGQVFKITLQVDSLTLNYIGGSIALGLFAAALGSGGLVGQLMGEKVIYPIRTGNDRPAIWWMLGLTFGGFAFAVIIYLLGVLWLRMMVSLASG